MKGKKLMKTKTGARANIRDVAELAGVSTATVSHVINETRYVSDEVKERVTKAMEQVGYYPNLLARSLRNNASKTVGLIIPDIANFYYTGLAEAVESNIRKQGYHMILSNSYDNIQNEADIIKLYNALQIDGVIMVPAAGSQSYLNTYAKGRYPIVFADRRPRDFNGDYVILENIQSTYSAIEFLIRQGHRKICLAVGNMELSTTNDRIKGYKKALEKYDLPFDESLIMVGSFSYNSGCEIAEKIIRRKEISAVFFANEMMAIGAISSFKKNNVRIPHDISVISCNDFKWTEITAPPLTVVSQPATILGDKAANLLIDRIHLFQEKKTVEGTTQLSVPTKIIIRNSCSEFTEK